MSAVFKREVGAIIRALSVGNVLCDVFAALIMTARIPVFAVSTAVHVVTAVKADVCSLHLDSLKIDLIAALKTEMMSLFYLWYIHGCFPIAICVLPFQPVFLTPDIG